MQKTIILEDLDCANCASKIEREIAKLKGVISVQVNFMTQKIQLEAEDELYDEVIKGIKKVVKKYEPDVTVLV